ncbi:MAG: hypothetical protein K2O37_06725, partial [Bacteroidales bacterium]|nr:hypothetical protein [Bacteroidales bacterium]
MKKLMFSLCALCLVGVASAQVHRGPLSEKAQSLSSPMLQKMKMQEMQKDSKATRRDSTVAPQAGYDWSRKIAKDAFLFYPSTAAQRNNPDKINPCYEDVMRWLYGTGGPITWAGAGEVGYSFHTGPGTYYNEAMIYPDKGVPYAASVTLLRYNSTSMGDVLMPFYFKLYDYTKVGPQRVIKSLEDGGFIDVVYPT